MNATSSQDEFAKWAKLRRNHDKVLAKYDEQSKDPLRLCMRVGLCSTEEKAENAQADQ